MHFIDLSHPFGPAMPSYPGDPASSLGPAGERDADGILGYALHTGMHVGTHIDAPLHMIEGGKKLSEFPPERFIGRGVLVDARGKDKIDEELLNSTSLKKDDIVLVMTGFSKKFGQKEYYGGYPELSEGFAGRLIKAGVKMVGIDTPSPDRAPFAVHKLLLGADVLIIENLANLEGLIGAESFEVIALPPRFEAEASPVRVAARIA